MTVLDDDLFHYIGRATWHWWMQNEETMCLLAEYIKNYMGIEDGNYSRLV